MARHTNRYGDAKDGASKERVNAEQLSLEAIMQAYHAKKANEKNSLTNKSGKSFKTTETVSAAAIFKNKKGSKCDKKNRKRKEKTPELISNFEGMYNSRYDQNILLKIFRGHRRGSQRYQRKYKDHFPRNPEQSNRAHR
jgi:hypothetical protein